MKIITKTIFLFSITFITINCFQQETENLNYIDKNKPDLSPKIFAPNFISNDSTFEFGSVFNEKGDEFFFAIDSSGISSIMYTQLTSGGWEKPFQIIAKKGYSYNDPFLSNDEQRLYYISDQPTNEQDSIRDYNIWYSERNKKSWSNPINIGDKINSVGNEFYISFAKNGSMYFASNKENQPDRNHDLDIYKSQFVNQSFQTPIKISDSINTKRYEADVFVAPDESYLIFCSFKKSGFGEGDLYISFKNKDGNWSKAKNMGNEINSEKHELCPFVTKDGKFLFYTSGGDIYWVSSEIIQIMKLKEFAQTD